MCVCVDFFVWRKNHWTLRIWGVWMCFLAGFFWISKPPGTWDPMILRVKKELRFLACILSIFCECAWLELFFHRVSLVVDISNRSFWICVMGFMDFFNASFESRKKKYLQKLRKDVLLPMSLLFNLQSGWCVGCVELLTCLGCPVWGYCVCEVVLEFFQEEDV